MKKKPTNNLVTNLIRKVIRNFSWTSVSTNYHSSRVNMMTEYTESPAMEVNSNELHPTTFSTKYTEPMADDYGATY